MLAVPLLRQDSLDVNTTLFSFISLAGGLQGSSKKSHATRRRPINILTGAEWGARERAVSRNLTGWFLQGIHTISGFSLRDVGIRRKSWVGCVWRRDHRIQAMIGHCSVGETSAVMLTFDRSYKNVPQYPLGSGP